MKHKLIVNSLLSFVLVGCSNHEEFVQDQGINSEQARAAGVSKGNIPPNLMFTNKHKRDLSGLDSGSKKGD